MLNIRSILNHILKGITEKNPRYIVKDHEHVIDTQTGTELHMYGDWFKVGYKDVMVAKMSDFTSEEQDIVWCIKQAITDPTKAKEYSDEYHAQLKKNREKFSDLFEYPEPVTSLKEEEGTVEYQG